MQILDPLRQRDDPPVLLSHFRQKTHEGFVEGQAIGRGAHSLVLRRPERQCRNLMRLSSRIGEPRTHR